MGIDPRDIPNFDEGQRQYGRFQFESFGSLQGVRWWSHPPYQLQMGSQASGGWLVSEHTIGGDDHHCVRRGKRTRDWRSRSGYGSGGNNPYSHTSACSNASPHTSINAPTSACSNASPHTDVDAHTSACGNPSPHADVNALTSACSNPSPHANVDAHTGSNVDPCPNVDTSADAHPNTIPHPLAYHGFVSGRSVRSGFTINSFY